MSSALGRCGRRSTEDPSAEGTRLAPLYVMTTILIIVLVVLLLGGGGMFMSRR